MILLYLKIIINQNTDEDTNNLSTNSINNCKTSENVITTTETLNNKTAPTRKEKFQRNTASFKLGSAETELNKRKNSPPIIREMIHLLVLKPLVVNHLV